MKSEPRFRWLKVRDLIEPRVSPKCTLLADGRVRVEGGAYYDCHTYRTRVAGTEIYSPDEDTWTKGDEPGVPAAARPPAKPAHAFGARLKKRERPTLTKLPSGAVLVTGGFETTCRFDGEEDDHSFREVELVDARTGEVHGAGQLPTGTHDHGVVVLACGAVLVIGGYEGDTQGSQAVQLGVPAGLDLSALGPALSKLAKKELGDQARQEMLDEVHALTGVGKLDAAEALARKAAKTFPDSADAIRAVGVTLSAAKRFDEAVKPLRRAADLEPDCPFVLLELADALFLSGERDAAKPLYARVVELCRDDPTWTWRVLQRAREQLQFLELESGDFKGVARTPGPEASSLEWNNAGAAASRLGRQDDARKAFERATEIDPKNDYAWGNLASMLTTLKRPNEALAAVQRTLKLCTNPRRKAEAYVSRGIALFDLGRYSASLRAYDASLKLHVLPYTWNNRANTLRKLKRDDEALESFERACALGWAAAHWGRASVWVARGDMKRAKAAVDEAARLDPSLVAQMRDDEELAPLWKVAPLPRRPKGKKKAKRS